VFLWSSAQIGGMGVADALAKRGSGFDAFRREVEQNVRFANITIIGASQYGVGMVAARVVVEAYLPEMSDDETRAQERSAETLRGAVGPNSIVNPIFD
jgi:malate/lactate dehydrogenase